MSVRVVSDIQPLAFGSCVYIWYNTAAHVVYITYISDLGDLGYIGDEKNLLQKSPNCGMDPNFDVSVPPTFVTEFSKKFESLNIKLVAV